MTFESKTITLKDGREAVLRAPVPEDAAPMLDFLTLCATETYFILRYPEECDLTVEQETAFINNLNASPNGVMIVADVNGEIAGNCNLSFHNRMKINHRASVAIGLISKYWNLGIGTAMFREMIELAKQKGVSQLELEFIEGNTRARALYEKMGFRIVGVKPNAFRLKDGTMLNEYQMVKEL